MFDWVLNLCSYRIFLYNRCAYSMGEVWRPPLLMKLFFQICREIFPHHLKFYVVSVYIEYVENMLKSTSNPQVEFKGNAKYLLKKLYYIHVIKLSCWVEKWPQKSGIILRFLTSIRCETCPTTNINIFLCDRPCLCWFNVGRLFGKTHHSR